MATYERNKPIGEGAYGTVYIAIRQSDNAKVAMKVLKNLDQEEDARRFRREVRLQAKLNHPNIVKIIGRKLRAERPWFVMELADHNLRRVLSEGPVSESDAVDIFRQLLAGLAHAHENRIIHRDLRPENVLVFSNTKANIKLGDFGAARIDTSDTGRLTRENQHIGTFIYSAPEQLISPHDADERADIYALGKLLYEILTGEQPIGDLRIGQLDSKFQYVVHKCTENRKEERFQSVEELRQAFELAIRPSELLEAPTEQVRDILSVYLFSHSAERISLLSELTQVLETNSDDGELYTAYVPRFPEALTSDFIETHPRSFERIIWAFDEHVRGGLPFAYTDVVADFYKTVFGLSESLTIKRLILARLLSMGVTHNRWHVMDVTQDLFSSIEDVAVAQVAADVIREDDDNAFSLRTQMLRRQLHELIRLALEDLDRTVG